MEEYGIITPPKGEEDTAGARRVFGEFVVLYHPLLVRIDEQLDMVISEAGPDYAEGYRPWQRALRDLLQGVYMMAKNIPLPDTERFYEALCMFSIDSAAEFIRNICIDSRLYISRIWAQQFQEHIKLLQFALSILHKAQQPQLQR